MGGVAFDPAHPFGEVSPAYEALVPPFACCRGGGK